MMKHIPSIYNYCDRWCARCPFTSRCTVYSSEQKLRRTDDFRSQEYWDQISDNLKKGLDLLGKKAAKFGIDINDITGEEMDEIRRQENEKRRLVSKHPLQRLTARYSRHAADLLQDPGFWTVAGAETIATVNRDPVLNATGLESGRILGFREVIGWYSLFIHLKFERALGSRMDEAEFDELYGNEDHDPDTYQRDANGSAKIALIAVQRSLEAWQGLYELIPDDDKIQPIFMLLRRIERTGKDEFPDWEKFRRPGFDAGE